MWYMRSDLVVITINILKKGFRNFWNCFRYAIITGTAGSYACGDRKEADKAGR